MQLAIAMRTAGGLIKATCLLVSGLLVSCTSQPDPSADTNEDGYISREEADLALEKISAVDLKPGEWQIKGDESEGTLPNDLQSKPGGQTICVSREMADEFLQEILGRFFRDELANIPSASCEYKELAITDGSILIHTSCSDKFAEGPEFSTTTEVSIKYSAESILLDADFKTDKFFEYGFEEGKTFVRRAKGEFKRTGACTPNS